MQTVTPAFWRGGASLSTSGAPQPQQVPGYGERGLQHGGPGGQFGGPGGQLGARGGYGHGVPSQGFAGRGFSRDFGRAGFGPHGPGMMHGGIGGFIGAIFFVAVMALVVAAFWQILKRAGYHPAFALLALVPIVNVAALLYLAFAEWPSARAAGAPAPEQVSVAGMTSLAEPAVPLAPPVAATPADQATTEVLEGQPPAPDAPSDDVTPSV